MYSGRIIVVATREDKDVDIYRFKNWIDAVDFMRKNRRSKRDDKAEKFEIMFAENEPEGIDEYFQNVVGR